MFKQKIQQAQKIIAQIPASNLWAIAGVVLLLIFAGYWLYTLHYVSTDDSYVNANVVQIAPRVTGQVALLYVNNNQVVKQGQPLFDLDPAPFNVAVEKAQAQMAMDQAELINAQLLAKRSVALVAKKDLAQQDADNAQAALQKAAAALQLAKANLEEAQLNLQYSHITAPSNGSVSNLTLREGDIVDANQPLFALISDQEYWIDANFKETDLRHIRPGQLADITLDMYGWHHFKGVVASVSGGSGAVFSLLPPENATGNWVKVTQRVPVRIRVIEPDPRYPLRIGTTADVTINLRKFYTQ